jgi:hypothetical protein
VTREPLPYPVLGGPAALLADRGWETGYLSGESDCRVGARPRHSQ